MLPDHKGMQYIKILYTLDISIVLFLGSLYVQQSAQKAPAGASLESGYPIHRWYCSKWWGTCNYCGSFSPRFKCLRNSSPGVFCHAVTLPFFPIIWTTWFLKGSPVFARVFTCRHHAIFPMFFSHVLSMFFWCSSSHAAFRFKVVFLSRPFLPGSRPHLSFCCVFVASARVRVCFSSCCFVSVPCCLFFSFRPGIMAELIKDKVPRRDLRWAAAWGPGCLCLDIEI